MEVKRWVQMEVKCLLEVNYVHGLNGGEGFSLLEVNYVHGLNGGEVFTGGELRT